MKFTLSWLKEHLDTTATLTEITDKLTAIGLELEEVNDPAARLAPFTVCYVESAEKHPDADKLRVCMVNPGDGNLVQVVCGAPNAKAGMKGVFAPNGAYIPGSDMTLKAGVIRGQESNGMLCSERELEISDEHDGIIELPEDAPLGMAFAEYRGLNDQVIEIGLTPNRGDCAGVRGIARDLAAAGIGTLKDNRPKADAGADLPTTEVKIAVEEKLNPVFVYRLVKNVKNGPAPAWLQQQLNAIGQKPISALVDVTNWMTMDQCRPMHVFDADKLKGNLTVRAATDGETMLALNGKEYSFDDQMVVIADDNGPVSLAGITGGENTGCDENTTNVLVEAALWDASNVARSGRKLDLHTDARFRFERGTDTGAVVEGMEIATQYILDFCGGEAGEIKVSGAVPDAVQTQSFRPERIEELAGISVETPK
ncbi:MAG: phenylalanine--tRNA ligase subunit beta, partial [Alphaproteobacteria bacterium]